jgi:hypothetical protein
MSSLLIGLLVSFIVHAAMGSPESAFSYSRVTWSGLLEVASFWVVFIACLLFFRSGLRIPASSILSLGVIIPPRAGAVCQEVPRVDDVSLVRELSQYRTVVVMQDGVPVGITGVKPGVIISWDDLIKVPSEVAITELKTALAKDPVVVVADENRVHGIITQSLFIQRG